MDLHLFGNKRILLSILAIVVTVTPVAVFAISKLQATENTSAAVKCNPNAAKISAAVCLQDMNDKVKIGMLVETQYTLKDSRDGRNYYVSKLKDGNVWMTQNLGLGTKDKTVALTPDDTDIKPSNSFRTLPKAMSDKCTKKDITSSWGNYFYDCKKMYSVANLKHYYQGFTLKTTGTRHQNLGNEYNRYTATAGTTGVAADEIREKVLKEHRGQNALDSICPAGWYLPTAAKYKTLMKTYVDMSVINDPQYRYTRDPHLEAQLNKLINAPIYFAPKEGGDYLLNGNGNNDSGYLTSTNFKTFLFSTTVRIEPESDIPENGRPWPDEWNSGFVRCIARADATYTVNYNVNGGTGTITASTKKSSHKQTQITLSKAAPTRKGYVFQGWSTKSNATKASYAKGQTITATGKNVTLYAVWAKLPTYSVTFNVNGGSGTVASQKCTPTTLTGSCNIIIPTTKPTRSGDKFIGWAESKNAIASAHAPNTTWSISGNKTLYAVYSPSHAISYDANGGSNAPASQNCYPETAQASCSIDVTTNKPTRDGYKFLGWAESVDANVVTIEIGKKGLSINDDKKLYAVWQKLVSVNTAVIGIGGTISESMKAEEGETITVEFTPDAGYKVDSVSATGIDTTNVVNNKLAFTLGSTDVDVTVKFIAMPDEPSEIEQKTYNLSFDANGGSGAPDNKSCTTSSLGYCVRTIPSDEPTQSGYRFLGWAESKNAVIAAKMPGNNIVLFGDKTVYAIWSPIFKLKLDYNNGTNTVVDGDECAPSRIDSSCVVNLPAQAPSGDEGSIFLGWAETDDATSAEYSAGSTIEIITNKTLYAVWKDASLEEASGGETKVVTWQQGQDYVKGNEEGIDIIVRIDYPLEKFSGVLLDNNLLDEEYYTVEPGSTIITVKNEYIETLGDGQHTLQANYNDGTTVRTGFAVTEDSGEEGESNDDWSADSDEGETVSIDYAMPETFQDQNFYNCVASAFTKEYPNEAITETGMTDSQLARVRVVSCSGFGKDDSKKVTNLSGLDKLTGLSQLNLSYNLISSINVSNNTSLTNLDVEGNNISSIDVAHNTALQNLNVAFNQLTALNISANEALTVLTAAQNSLSEQGISFSNNAALVYLDISNNQFNSVDLSSNTLLEFLDVSYNKLFAINLANNTALSWLNVGRNNLSELNVTSNKELEVLIAENNNIATIDLSQNTKLKNININNNELELLAVGNIPGLEALMTSNNKLNELDLSGNPALINLVVANNQLDSMDVKKNTLLENLDASNNNLAKLDINDNVNLVSLNLAHNKLSELDVSQNTGLGSMDVSDNDLTSIDVSQNDMLSGLLVDDILIKAGAKATTTNGAAVDFDMSSIKFLDFDVQTIEDTDDYTFNKDTIILTVKKFDENGNNIQISSSADYQTYKLQLMIKNNIEEDEESLEVPNTGGMFEDDEGVSGAMSVIAVVLIVAFPVGLFMFRQRKSHKRFSL